MLVKKGVTMRLLNDRGSEPLDRVLPPSVSSPYRELIECRFAAVMKGAARVRRCSVKNPEI